jgi:DNA-directed RNA polymerase
MIGRSKGASKQLNNSCSLSSLQEHLAVVHALIQNRDLDRAEKILNELFRTNRDDMLRFMDVNVYNAFIEGWMDMVPRSNELTNDGELKLDAVSRRERSDAVRNGVLWFLRINHEGAQPDSTSYALVLRGLLRAGESDQVLHYLAEAKRHDEALVASEYSYHNSFLRNVITHSYLTSGLDEDLVGRWKEILTKSGFEVPNNVLGMTVPDLKSTIVNNFGEGNVSREAFADTALILDREIRLLNSKVEEAKREMEEAVSVSSIGMEIVHDHLSALRDHVGTSHFSKYALQLKLEEEGYNAAKKRFLSEIEPIGNGTIKCNRKLQEYIWAWHEKLCVKIQKEISLWKAKVAARPPKNRAISKEPDICTPFLSLLTPEKLSMITITELLRLHAPLSSDLEDGEAGEVIKLNRVVVTIGTAVESEINAQALNGKMKNKDAQSKAWATSYLDKRLFTNRRIFNMTVRNIYAALQDQGNYMTGDSFNETATPDGISQGLCFKNWPQSIRARIGSTLVSFLLEIATVQRPITDRATGAEALVDIPAFTQTYTYLKGKKLGILKYHPYICELLSNDPVRSTLAPRMLPMVVQPRPWLTYMSGGYLTSRSPCMRVKDQNPEQFAYLRAAAKNNRLNFVLASLDVLGSTPWEVNPEVLNVVLQVWNSGEEFASIPPLLDDEKKKKIIPKPPPDLDTNPSARREHKESLRRYQNNVRNAYSLRCDTNYKIEIARMVCEFFLECKLDISSLI